tara:strand:- start:1581 stop:1883 length:303 start_codon:yes stop_codon:yes gene_type:complete
MHDFEEDGAKIEQPLFACHAPESGAPVITVDYEAYAHFLDDTSLSEEDKRILIQSLWNVVVEFVSMGFGVHPLQQAGACEAKDIKSIEWQAPKVLEGMES